MPIRPERVNKPLVLPEQIVLPPDTVPPAVCSYTVIVAVVELAGEHTPLVTKALYSVVCVRVPVLHEVLVLAISVQFIPLFMDNCHLFTDPV